VNSAFEEENQSNEIESDLEDFDWVAEKQKKTELEVKQKNKDKSQREINLKQLKFLKEEGISLAERDCLWQAIGRWDEALEIKVYEKSAIELEHEKILDMKAQVLITLHEWEPAIEAAKSAIKIEPKWWSAYQTLGRAHLGFGQLQDAVFAFSRAVHLSPETEELWIEDLHWAADLLNREKSGNREWKPIKTPEVSDEEELVSDEELERLRGRLQ
jgi:tetratricopeptide (TPR) repeat protein